MKTVSKEIPIHAFHLQVNSIDLKSHLDTVAQMVKEYAYNVGDWVQSHRLGESLEKSSNLFPVFLPENPIGREAW